MFARAKEMYTLVYFFPRHTVVFWSMPYASSNGVRLQLCIAFKDVSNFCFFCFRSTLPIWEENVIFNENFDYLCQPTMSVMLFFEVSCYVTDLIVCYLWQAVQVATIIILPGMHVMWTIAVNDSGRLSVCHVASHGFTVQTWLNRSCFG